jgi:hypothetical protein
MGIEEVKTAPHSPWLNPYCEIFNGILIPLLRVGGLHHRYIYDFGDDWEGTE